MDFLLLIIVFSVANAVPSDLRTSFPWDKTKLAKCMGNQILHFSDVLGFSFVNREVANLIGDHVAGEVSGRILPRYKLRAEISKFKTELNSNLSERFSDEKNLVKRLSILISNALHMCSDDDKPKSLRLPAFDNEIAAVGKIIDYILVKWPLKLKHMIRTKKNRALLRKFINEAKPLLKNALLETLNVDYFRNLLRMYWANRAKWHYDGRDPDHPYPIHQYTLENPTVHTNDDINNPPFSDRSNQSIEVRSPVLPQYFLKKILNIHFADRPGFGEYDSFAMYKNMGGISSHQFYLESQIDDFYRLWFFDEALQAGGILTDDDDVDEGDLKGHYDAQEIIADDDKYRDFLLEARIEESSVNTRTPMRQCLGKRARVCEEELVLLRMMNTPSTSGVTPQLKTTTSTTAKSLNTTPDDQPGSSKRKNDRQCEDLQGNNFLKRSKTVNGCDKSGSRDIGGSVSSCNQCSDSLTSFKANDVFKDCFLIQILQQLRSSAEGFMINNEDLVNQKIF